MCSCRNTEVVGATIEGDSRKLLLYYSSMNNMEHCASSCNTRCCDKKVFPSIHLITPQLMDTSRFSKISLKKSTHQLLSISPWIKFYLHTWKGKFHRVTSRGYIIFANFRKNESIMNIKIICVIACLFIKLYKYT